MNDAAVDRAGRLWAGSLGPPGAPGSGALHRWDGVSASTVRADGLRLPNGIGWSPDGRTLYLVETLGHRVLTARFSVEDGQIGSLHPWLEIPGAMPDGLCIDAEGAAWIAFWGAGEVRRFDPGGRQIGVVRVPVSQPTSCTLADDGTLYITSARTGLGPERLEREPHAGAVFAVRVGASRLAPAHMAAPPPTAAPALPTAT